MERLMTHTMNEVDGYGLLSAFVCRMFRFFWTGVTSLFSNKYNDPPFVCIETMLLKMLHLTCTVCGDLCYEMYL